VVGRLRRSCSSSQNFALPAARLRSPPVSIKRGAGSRCGVCFGDAQHEQPNKRNLASIATAQGFNAMKHRHKLSQRQRQRPAPQNRRSEAQERTNNCWRPGRRNALSTRCMSKAGEPSIASTNSVAAIGACRSDLMMAERLADPPAFLTMRAENSRRPPRSAKALSAGYRTNCSARDRPTSTVADRSIVDTTSVAQLRQLRLVRPRCRTSLSHLDQTRGEDDPKRNAAE
jgi:hypothetical protein